MTTVPPLPAYSEFTVIIEAPVDQRAALANALIDQSCVESVHPQLNTLVASAAFGVSRDLTGKEVGGMTDHLRDLSFALHNAFYREDFKPINLTIIAHRRN